MRSRGKDRRDEQKLGTRSLRQADLAKVVRRCRPDRSAPTAMTAMAAVGSPLSRQLRRTREKEKKSPPPRHPLHAREELAPVRLPIVPEDDSRSSRQPLQRRPQFFSLPLVGHEPEARQRLAAVHGASYSSAMSEASPAVRLENVRSAIARAARLGRRDADAVELIAVSKTQPAEAILPLIEAGQRAFGENRVQEAQAKWPALRTGFPDLQLHLIGSLQSNKAEEAVALFDVIHSVDRPSLVQALQKAIARTGRSPRCFVQVNIGGEEQKGGCAVADLPPLLQQCAAAGLDVAGLMCIPPADVEAAPYFALLAKLARRDGLDGLSMGMSSDFETAVTIGATHVRVGTALFGERR
jgi:pyridoxal phosphate enzyme (YggS family)